MASEVASGDQPDPNVRGPVMDLCEVVHQHWGKLWERLIKIKTKNVNVKWRIKLTYSACEERKHGIDTGVSNWPRLLSVGDLVEIVKEHEVGNQNCSERKSLTRQLPPAFVYLSLLLFALFIRIINSRGHANFGVTILYFSQHCLSSWLRCSSRVLLWANNIINNGNGPRRKLRC